VAGGVRDLDGAALEGGAGAGSVPGVAGDGVPGERDLLVQGTQ